MMENEDRPIPENEDQNSQPDLLMEMGLFVHETPSQKLESLSMIDLTLDSPENEPSPEFYDDSESVKEHTEPNSPTHYAKYRKLDWTMANHKFTMADNENSDPTYGTEKYPSSEQSDQEFSSDSEEATEDETDFTELFTDAIDDVCDTASVFPWTTVQSDYPWLPENEYREAKRRRFGD